MYFSGVTVMVVVVFQAAGRVPSGGHVARGAEQREDGILQPGGRGAVRGGEAHQPGHPAGPQGKDEQER